METTTRAVIPLSTALSHQAKIGHIFDNLKSGSLISIGQLYQHCLPPRDQRCLEKNFGPQTLSLTPSASF
jgi:hypothetical protein